EVPERRVDRAEAAVHVRADDEREVLGALLRRVEEVGPSRRELHRAEDAEDEDEEEREDPDLPPDRARSRGRIGAWGRGPEGRHRADDNSGRAQNSRVPRAPGRRLFLLVAALCVAAAVLDGLQTYLQARLVNHEPVSWPTLVWRSSEWLILGALTPITLAL